MCLDFTKNIVCFLILQKILLVSGFYKKYFLCVDFTQIFICVLILQKILLVRKISFILFRLTVNTTVEKPLVSTYFLVLKKNLSINKAFIKFSSSWFSWNAQVYIQVWFRYSLDPNLTEFELEDQLYQMCLQVYRVDTWRILCFRFQGKLWFGNLNDIIIYSHIFCKQYADKFL